MSPCYERDCLAIHFTWKKNWDGVRQLLPAIEEKLSPFDAGPHWGKLFAMPPGHLRSLYPRLPDFKKLIVSFDPRGKFRNGFLDRIIFGKSAGR
jgi:xylitol oxidase